MTPLLRRASPIRDRFPGGWARRLAAVSAAGVLGLGAAGALAAAAMPVLAGTTAPMVAESGPPWAALTVAQQQDLAPLKAQWPSIDAARKEKWLDVAGRMPSMGETERARIQQRMTEWVRMSPAERGRARIQFQEARKVAPVNRAEQWQAYQALPADQRRELAEKASATKKPVPGGSGASATSAARRPDTAAPLAAEAKRNVVPFLPSPTGTAPKQVAPAVVQSRPGATTSLVTTPARPPLHQQAGLPKINAGAGFVDPATLLPRRGPQGAAIVATQPASSNAR